MDQLTTEQSGIRGEIERAASEAGIIPGDPLWRVFDRLGEAVEQLDTRVSKLPERIAEAVTPVDRRMDGLIKVAKDVSDRPLVTSHQLQYTLLPALIGAISFVHAVVLAVLLLIAIGGWWMWWQTPTLTCADQPDGANICYVIVRPAAVQPPPPPATEQPQAQSPAAARRK
jgi:hypothetical protein